MEALAVLNFDLAFKNSVCSKVIPCNTEVLKTRKQVTELIKYIFVDGDVSDVLRVVCDCGKSSGQYRLGSMCPHCNTVVRSSTALELGYSAWLEIPECLPPLLQPLVYNTLRKWMGKYHRQPLLDMFLSADGVLPEQLGVLFKPGVRYFYDNFDTIMNYLLTEHKPLRMYTPRKGGEIKENQKSIDMAEYLKVNREALFARYFPILDKNLHVLNKHGTMSDADETSQHILKVAIEIANVNLVYSMASVADTQKLDSYGYTITTTYALYSSTILRSNLLTKYGFIRRNILGARCHYSFRAVIAPVTDLASPDELKLPWSVAVLQFKLEILNLLIRRYNYSFIDAQQKHQRATEEYDDDINNILKTLVEECPYKGLPILFGRNPMMEFLGMQLFFAVEIKTSLTDDTISMHALTMPRPNADADGDA